MIGAAKIAFGKSASAFSPTVPSCLDLNGALSQGLFLTSQIPMGIATPGSVVMWFKPASIVSDSRLCSSADGAFYISERSTNTLRLRANNQTQDGNLANNTITLNAWQMITAAGCYLGGEHVYWSIVVNAIPLGAGYASGSGVNGLNVIGGGGDVPADIYHPLTARICEVSFWNIVLVEGQCTELYNSGVFKDPRTVSFASNLTNYWKCGVGDTRLLVRDRVGSNDLITNNITDSTFIADHP